MEQKQVVVSEEVADPQRHTEDMLFRALMSATEQVLMLAVASSRTRGCY